VTPEAYLERVRALRPALRERIVRVERVRPASERRSFNGQWPEALEPLSDTYVDQVFQGPFG
jgi:hypothetical protein